MEANINLSVIILGYRAGDSIKEFAQKTKEIVRKLTSSFEIILVGNYIENSEDKTKDIIEKFVDDNPDFISICKPKKGMMGWDMKEGLNISTGKYICVIDGDGQFPIESIEK